MLFGDPAAFEWKMHAADNIAMGSNDSPMVETQWMSEGAVKDVHFTHKELFFGDLLHISNL